MTATPAYDALKAQRQRIRRLEHIQSVATWDRMTHMPAGAAVARAAAQAELETVVQRLQTDPALDDLIARAHDEALDEAERADLALMRRDRKAALAIPEDLAARKTEATGAAMTAWTRARSANDWTIFAAALDPLIALVRDCADRLGAAFDLARYDALLDQYDRGLRLETVRALFDDVEQWLPGLIVRIRARQANTMPREPAGPFPTGGQRELCLKLMALLGFNFEGGRLDESAHPFTGGSSEDVRITTRFRDDQVLPALFAVIHETGHARYQAALPEAWRGQPLGEACSGSMHEAQALLLQRQLGQSRPFLSALSPMLTETFGAQPAFDPENLHHLMARVAPSRVRTEADEATYPAHVILRTRLEAALIAGDLKVADVPAAWDAQMKALLDLDPDGDARNGPLQDIHWAQGMFGYFPAYLLGAMIAAQLDEAFSRTASAGGLEARIAALGAWLEAEIWRQGSRWTTPELVARTTGRPLGAGAFRRHLERRYLEDAA